MAGTFKPVGVDADSLFPPRVETRLAGTYTPYSSASVGAHRVPRWDTATSRQVFAALPFIDLAADYGVVLDTNTSAAATANKTALQAAVDDLAASSAQGGTIRLPAGRIYLNGTITIPIDRHIQIEGVGMSHSGGVRWGTVLYRLAGFTGDLISAIGTTTTRALFVLRDIGVTGAGVAATCVRIARASEIVLDTVRISGSGGEALVLTNVWNAYVNNCFFHTSGNAGSNIAAVRMDAPSGEDGNNGVFFTSCQWENNNGVGLRITGTLNWSIVNHFVNCKWEDSQVATTWPLVELLQAAATIFSACWFMKGRRTGDMRATGPLVRLLGPGPTNDTERRANIVSGSTFSYWGDTTTLLDHQAGALVVTGSGFAGTPTESYINVASGVGADDSIISGNYYEHPANAIRDQRTTRHSNVTNGVAGALAPSAPGWTGQALAVSANNGRVVRFSPDRNMRVKGIGFHVYAAATVDDAIDVGIYDKALTTKMASSGSTAGLLTSTGKKRINFGSDVLLTAGETYYVAASVGTIGGTAAQLAGANYNISGISAFHGTTAGLVDAASVGTIFPLPATITPGVGSTAGFALFLHEV
jgi:hypothetical protein